MTIKTKKIISRTYGEWRERPHSEILIKGIYLTRHGFDPDGFVTITVNRGEILIYPVVSDIGITTA